MKEDFVNGPLVERVSGHMRLANGLMISSLGNLVGADNLFHPSRDWRHGGPIIQRECIAIFRQKRESLDGWAAMHPDASAANGLYGSRLIECDEFDGVWGWTPLIAAMRAYVASKLGEEVELP